MGEECEMQGWLHLLRFNRFGLQYSRKRYFILEDSCLRSFKSITSSETEEPLRSAIIDSCVRVIDNGRESHRMKLFFMFTLVNTSNHNDMLKLGATSSEDAARWIRALQDAAINSVNSLTSCSERKWQPFSLSVSKRMANKRCLDDRASVSSEYVIAMTSDVIAPSPWKIFGCQNGLRLFKESKDKYSKGKPWGNQPAIMAVGIIDGASEDVFHTLMSLGTLRTEWDFCFYRGSVIEHLDGHTDIIYIQLYNHWSPWPMKRRDLLLRRYWRREEDGTYVILYHSVVHRKCPPRDGYVRAYLKSGGYVISPAKQGKECVIKNMLAVDWRFWKSYISKASSRSITICMLGRVAALRELFRTKSRNSSHECVSRDLTIDTGSPSSDKEASMTEIAMKRVPYKDEDEPVRQISGASSLGKMDDAADEFFDVPEPMDDESLETEWCSIKSPDLCYVDKYQPKLSSSANFVKKLHDLAVQKKGYLELREISWEESVSSHYGTTLRKDSTFNMPCSWAEADASSFLLRGGNYLQDHRKIKAKGTLMEMVAADWLRSDKREDDLAGRYGGIIQVQQ